MGLRDVSSRVPASPFSTPSERWKGDASTNCPASAPPFDTKLSTNMPMVMRDGKACGLMIRSGRMPKGWGAGRKSGTEG